MSDSLTFLVVLAFAAAATALVVLGARRREASLARLVPQWPAAPIARRSLPHWRSLCACLLLAGVLLAPAREVEQPAARDEGGTVIVVDLSRSMLTRDVEPDRLLRALTVIADGVAAHSGPPYGVVGFASEAMVACPLTTDTAAVLAALAGLAKRPVVGSTSIGRGLDAALRMFAGSTGNRGVVLATDGEDLDGEIDGALARFVQSGIPVSVLGVGTRKGAVVPAVLSGAAPDRRGASRLNTNLLREIASRTGGTFVQVDQTDKSADVAQLLAGGSAGSPGLTTLPRFAFAAVALAGLFLAFEFLPGMVPRTRGDH